MIAHPNPLVPKFIAAREQLAKRFSFVQCKINFSRFADDTEYVVADWVDKGDEWRMQLAPAPTGHVPDPEGLLAAWDHYQAEHEALVQKGEMPELNPNPEAPFGVCHGAIFCGGGFGHPKLAPLEQQFIDGVPRHFDDLVRVLREDADPGRRIGAVELLTCSRSRDALLAALLPSVVPRTRECTTRSSGCSEKPRRGWTT